MSILEIQRCRPLVLRKSENFDYRKLDRNIFFNANTATTANFRKSTFSETSKLY